MMQLVGNTLRGFAMGAADIVPGVSGGTIALLLGIYERLVDSVRSGAGALAGFVRLDYRRGVERLEDIEWQLIGPLLVGIGLALVSLASVIDQLLEDNAEAMAGLFSGLVLASIIVAWRMLVAPGPTEVAVVIAIALTTFLLLGFQSGPVADPTLLAFFGSGAIAICAMILPGISGSFLLLMLGMYAAVLDAVTERRFLDLLVFTVGAVIGLALFSTLLTWLLDRFRNIVLAALIGLMLGSFRVLWPWPDGVGIISSEADEVVSGTEMELPTSEDLWAPLILGVAAAAVVLLLSWWGERRGAGAA